MEGSRLVSHVLKFTAKAQRRKDTEAVPEITHRLRQDLFARERAQAGFESEATVRDAHAHPHRLIVSL